MIQPTSWPVKPRLLDNLDGFELTSNISGFDRVARLAQLAEQLTLNQRVRGSIPWSRNFARPRIVSHIFANTRRIKMVITSCRRFHTVVCFALPRMLSHGFAL